MFRLNSLFTDLADHRPMSIDNLTDSGPGARIQDPVPPALCKSMRLFMLALGILCTGLGIVGIILPVMPGTVFLLIAAWAFSRSSERLHLWLYHHPRFGRTIRNWHQYRAIPIKAKIMAVTMMAGSFIYILVTLNQNWMLPVLIGALLVPVAIWIVTRPSLVRADG
jgi:uncharacterized protein